MKTRARAVFGSLAFFVVAPVTVGGWIPHLITGWRLQPPLFGPTTRVFGGALVALGSAALVDCFRRFALEGLGTPAPIAPTEQLVASGLYRHVRNPMYVALLMAVLGQALLFGSGKLLWYAAGLWLIVHAWVVFYEEPALTQQFGDSYRLYRANVRRWLPRLAPWHLPGPAASLCADVSSHRTHDAIRARRERSAPAGVRRREAEIAFACKACGQEAISGLDGPGRCRTCGAEAQLTIPPALRETRVIERCPACDSTLLYVQRDFNQKVGLGVVVVGALLAPFTPFYSSLVVAALVDAGLYALLPEITVCYRCHAHFRGFARNPKHETYDLHIAEQYDVRKH